MNMGYVDSSLVAKRDWERAHAQHQQHLQTISSTAQDFRISEQYYKTRQILSHGKAHQDYQHVNRLQQQNLKFMDKLLTAQLTARRTSSSSYQDSLNYRARKKEVDRLNAENMKLAQRIVSVRSAIPMRRYQEHYTQLKKIKKLRSKVRQF